MGVTLPAEVAAVLLGILEALAGESQNLTRISDPDAAVERHLADSLSALGAGLIPVTGQLIDIGSGSGFPGLALAAACPGLEVSLLEAEGRKADWLRRASATLSNVRVIHDRAESLALRQRGQWNIATARAVGSLSTVIELAAPLLSTDGRFVAWRGPRVIAEEDRGDAVAEILGFAPGQVISVQPFPGAERHLHAFDRVSETPDRFPRRDGRAAHRPLL